MQRLTEQILVHAEGLPEGTPLAAKSLLHLGNRAGVDQALSRLAERGQLIRAGRGVYLRPVKSRFGTRAPSVEQAVEALAAQRGEVIVPNGAAEANRSKSGLAEIRLITPAVALRPNSVPCGPRSTSTRSTS